MALRTQFFGSRRGAEVQVAAQRGRVIGGWSAFALALAVFPLVATNPTITTIGVFTLIYMTAASGWNLFAGYSGYISFGHTVFFGVGAYAFALTQSSLGIGGGLWSFGLVPLAAVLAAVVAVPFGLIALRTRRVVFMIVTIALFFICQLLAYNLSFTHGTAGVSVTQPGLSGVAFNQVFYYAVLIALAVTVGVSALVRRSRFGLQLLAIRDDEDRALGLGVDTWGVKLVALILSAGAVGATGALYAYFLGQVYPDFAFTPIFDLSMLLMAILGGLGTVSGPVLGALILEPVQQYFTLRFPDSNLYLIFYGLFFIPVILFMPRGLVPTLVARRAARLERAGSTPVQRVGGSSTVGATG